MAIYRFTLHIGISNADQEDDIEIPDEELEGLNQDELEAFLAKEWEQWTKEYIDGGWECMEDEG